MNDALLELLGFNHMLPQSPIDAAAPCDFHRCWMAFPSIIRHQPPTSILMMDAFGSGLRVHLSSVNHLYLNRLIRLGDELEVWVRFVGLQSLRQGFNLPSYCLPKFSWRMFRMVLILTDPFRSFHQTYHLMNMRLFSPEMMVKLGVVLHLFSIKFIISKYEPLTAHGYIKTLIFRQ